jgi:hypothetical protein
MALLANETHYGSVQNTTLVTAAAAAAAAEVRRHFGKETAFRL